MLFIITELEDNKSIMIDVKLESVDDFWMDNCYKIGLSDFDIILEKMFRYAEHYMYKSFFKKSYRIPKYRNLGKSTKENIIALGNLLYSFYNLSVNLYGLVQGVFIYNMVRNDFKRYYILDNKPVKRDWIIKHKKQRANLSNYINPFEYKTSLYNLISSALKYSEINHTFKLKVFNQFISDYKKWCEVVSSEKYWYDKAVF